MLAREVINEARVHLQDTRGPGYRYTDEQLLEYVNNFEKEVLRIRPDLFVGIDFTLTTLTLSSTLAVDDQYKSAAVYFVVGHAMLREDEYADDGRAVAMLARATAQLGASLV